MPFISQSVIFCIKCLTQFELLPCWENSIVHLNFLKKMKRYRKKICKMNSQVMNYEATISERIFLILLGTQTRTILGTQTLGTLIRTQLISCFNFSTEIPSSFSKMNPRKGVWPPTSSQNFFLLLHFSTVFGLRLFTRLKFLRMKHYNVTTIFAEPTCLSNHTKYQTHTKS